MLERMVEQLETLRVQFAKQAYIGIARDYNADIVLHLSNAMVELSKAIRLLPNQHSK